MVVNSINFWLFFIAVLIPYFVFFRNNWGRQNLWLLLASYFFYGWADWKMIPLLAIVTIVFYWLGLEIGKNNKANPQKASHLTTIGVVLGVGVLIYFKYLGFLVHEFAQLFETFGFKTNLSAFNIIMPIGISFFTFKLMSYVIEVHRENIEPTKDVVQFGTYIAFFPTILSGPIDKPNTFLNQLQLPRIFNEQDVSEGFKRVLWGMFLKMCIADRISPWTDAVFNNYSHHNATSIIVAAFLYLIQIYADFCGYSEMAIGVSRVMGIKVSENFRRPFFAQNIAEYWRNWHITLTSWVTTYVFTPLTVAFRDWGVWGTYLATLINLVVIGAWHGANWTFVLFGVYHGLLIILVLAIEKRRKKFEKKYNLKKNEYYKWCRRTITFVLCVFGMVLWRSDSVGEFLNTLVQLESGFGSIFPENANSLFVGVFSFFLLFVKELCDEYNYNVHMLHSDKTYVRIISMVILACYILLFGELEGNAFIYFQF